MIRISPLSLGRGLLFRPQKVVGCVVAAVVMTAVGVLAIGAFIFFSWQRHQRLVKLTAAAPAQILEVKVTSKKRSESSRNYSTRITYSFQAQERTIETEWTKSDDVSDEYEVGRRAKVCYDPSNPDDNEIFTLSYRCGQ